MNDLEIRTASEIWTAYRSMKSQFGEGRLAEDLLETLRDYLRQETGSFWIMDRTLRHMEVDPDRDFAEVLVESMEWAQK